jgi:hypothetical protein
LTKSAFYANFFFGTCLKGRLNMPQYPATEHSASAKKNSSYAKKDINPENQYI